MAKRWEAVEHEDDSTCEPCDAIDGTLYRNREDAYADYPGGVGYRLCVGAQFGNSCRGRVVKRRGGERTDSSMTDTRLLNEFRARLAERAALQPRMANTTPARVRKPGADWFRIENLTADEASIYIFDEIGFFGTTAQGFVDQLNAVTTPKITVYLNSPGGEVFDGIAIHTALAQSKAHVTTFITGMACSAASFIAMAGDTIKMARNATMMIHDASGLAWGNATTMRAEADLLDKLSLNIADMYSMQAGGTAEEWFARIENAEIWYTGKEALAAGLVDEITDADDPEEEDAPSNRLSLAAFNYSGRAEAPEPPSAFLEETPPPPPEDASPVTQDAECIAPADDVAETMLAFLAERIKRA
jgi:ATP-dependent Clp endopeptidase proteolytic subunit ClpP